MLGRHGPGRARGTGGRLWFPIVITGRNYVVPGIIRAGSAFDAPDKIGVAWL
jgi:hypothetical protein